MLTNEMIEVVKRRQEAILKGKIEIAELKNDTGLIKELKRDLQNLELQYRVVRLMGVKNFEQVLFHIKNSDLLSSRRDVIKSTRDPATGE
jgi:hypothetical protein